MIYHKEGGASTPPILVLLSVQEAGNTQIRVDLYVSIYSHSRQMLISNVHLLLIYYSYTDLGDLQQVIDRSSIAMWQSQTWKHRSVLNAIFWQSSSVDCLKPDSQYDVNYVMLC